MAFTVSSIAGKDSAGVAIGGGLLAGDIAGSGVGPFFLYHGIIDGAAGVNKAAVKAASTAAVATDAALVVALSPNGLKITEKWVAGATAGWASAFGTELNSLASGSSVMSSVAIDNSSNVDMFCDVSFSLGSVLTTGVPYLGLYAYPLLQDGSSYGDGRFGSSAAAIPPQNYYCGFAGLPVGTQVLLGEFQLPGRRSPLIIPPGGIKFVIYNGAGVNLAGSSNTIKYRTYNRQVY